MMIPFFANPGYLTRAMTVGTTPMISGHDLVDFSKGLLGCFPMDRMGS